MATQLFSACSIFRVVTVTTDNKKSPVLYTGTLNKEHKRRLKILKVRVWVKHLCCCHSYRQINSCSLRPFINPLTQKTFDINHSISRRPWSNVTPTKLRNVNFVDLKVNVLILLCATHVQIVYPTYCGCNLRSTFIIFQSAPPPCVFRTAKRPRSAFQGERNTQEETNTLFKQLR